MVEELRVLKEMIVITPLEILKIKIKCQMPPIGAAGHRIESTTISNTLSDEVSVFLLDILCGVGYSDCPGRRSSGRVSFLRLQQQ